MPARVLWLVADVLAHHFFSLVDAPVRALLEKERLRAQGFHAQEQFEEQLCSARLPHDPLPLLHAQ